MMFAASQLVVQLMAFGAVDLSYAPNMIFIFVNELLDDI